MWRNRFYYSLLLFAMLYLAVMYQEFTTTSLVLCLAILPLIDLLISACARSNISVKLQSHTAAAVKGNEYHVIIFLKNRFFLPVSRIKIVLNCRSGVGQAWRKEQFFSAVPGESEKQLTCVVLAEYCGNMEFSLKRIYYYDFLGLWKFRLREMQSLRVPVLPSVYELISLPLSAVTDTYSGEEDTSLLKRGEDPTELYGAREYLYGDKFNRIHWKMTAKEGKLMVKEFGKLPDNSILVMIEVIEYLNDKGIIMDTVVEIICSIAVKILHRKRSFYLTWYDANAADIVRLFIESEDSLYEALAIFYNHKAGIGIHTLSVYRETYRYDQYSDVFYVYPGNGIPEMNLLREYQGQAGNHIISVREDKELMEEEAEFISGMNTYNVVRPVMQEEDITILFQQENIQ